VVGKLSGFDGGAAVVNRAQDRCAGTPAFRPVLRGCTTICTLLQGQFAGGALKGRATWRDPREPSRTLDRPGLWVKDDGLSEGATLRIVRPVDRYDFMLLRFVCSAERDEGIAHVYDEPYQQALDAIRDAPEALEEGRLLPAARLLSGDFKSQDLTQAHEPRAGSGQDAPQSL